MNHVIIVTQSFCIEDKILLIILTDLVSREPCIHAVRCNETL